MSTYLDFTTLITDECLFFNNKKLLMGSDSMLIDKIKLELVEQRKSKFKGNIYHYSQVNFAYNSNKIEGDV